MGCRYLGNPPPRDLVTRCSAYLIFKCSCNGLNTVEQSADSKGSAGDPINVSQVRFHQCVMAADLRK
jgi:hypothetical protein